MKKLIFTSVLAFLFILLSCNENNESKEKLVKTNPKLELVWQTDTILTTCESALYDKNSGVIYVSNINNNPWDLDSNGFISKIDTTGKILDLKWVTSGLSGPKGMGMYNGKLYVNDIDRIVEIDIVTAKISNSYHVGGNPQLNDITVSDKGIVYSSGSGSNTIYSLQGGKLEAMYIDNNFNRLNGLLDEEKGIYYISSGDNNFGFYDLKKNNTRVLTEGLGNGDGIIKLENNDFIVSDWKGQLFYINHSDWSSIKILDTREDGVYSADIGYVPEHNLLLVPTFFSNKVMCYKISF